MNDITKAGNPDNDTININEAFELRNWSDKFGVTIVQLKAAANAVGISAKKVEEYLKKR